MTEELGGDPGLLCGAGKGIMAAAGIGRACPSLDVRPQALKGAGVLFLVSLFLFLSFLTYLRC